MPYICLTRSDIPDGITQVLDLLPNASQRVPGYDPPAQTRYVNRVQNDPVTLVTGVARGDKYGLAAYLLDTVEPGGLQFGTADIDFDAVLAADTVTLGGVVFTATDGLADPSVQEFSSFVGAGGDESVLATSFIDAVNDAATQLLLDAAGSTVTATAGGSLGAGQVTLTADTAGSTGALTLVESTAGVRITLSADHLTRTFEAFTAAHVNNIADRIIARMDAASALTVTDVNTAINAEAGVSGCSLVSVGSAASLTDLLSILAGRGYILPHNSTIYSGAGYDMWHAAAAGSFFTTENTQLPVKGITSTYHTTSFDISVLEGTLAQMTAGMVLWPNSDVGPKFPLTYTQTTARIVTVYDDDGSVIV